MASLIKRGKRYYAQYCVAGKAKRVSLDTDNLQIAKEKVRQLESAMARHDDIPIPMRTRLPELLRPSPSLRTSRCVAHTPHVVHSFRAAPMLAKADGLSMAAIAPDGRTSPAPNPRLRPFLDTRARSTSGRTGTAGFSGSTGVPARRSAFDFPRRAPL